MKTPAKIRGCSLPVPSSFLTIAVLSLLSAGACKGGVTRATTLSTAASTGGGATGAGGDGGATGAGGDGGATGAGGADAAPPMDCPASQGPIDPTALIDDMEDGDDKVAPIGGRTGMWWAGGDATPGGTIDPNGVASPEMIPGGRCDSHFAMHVTGQGFNDWGAILQVPFGYAENDAGVSGYAPYNASARQGITFWARVGDTSTNVVRYAVSDEHARPEAGLCVVNGPPGETCYDTFGVSINDLSTDWKQYKIPFAGLTQRMFGVHADALDTHSIYSIDFSFGPGAVFDFWLDDIAFY